jgi:hypothetical protein
MNWHQVTEWGRSEVVRLSRSGTPEELMRTARLFKVCRLMVGAVEYGGRHQGNAQGESECAEVDALAVALQKVSRRRLRVVFRDWLRYEQNSRFKKAV